jgi:hypothetical protein
MKRMVLVGCLQEADCGELETERLESENHELHEQVSALQAQLANVREKALESSSSDLQQQMARFQSEDWKEVAPVCFKFILGYDLPEAPLAMDARSKNIWDITLPVVHALPAHIILS